MNEPAKITTTSQPALAGDLAATAPMDIMKTELAIGEISERLQRAKLIAEDMKAIDQELSKLRSRIVVWSHECTELDPHIPQVLAYAVCSVLSETRSALERAYYTLGEQFTAINVEKEFPDVIPF